MADGEFVTIIGSVEFPPTERTIKQNGSDKNVRDVTIRGVHNQKKYRVTLWPNLADVEVAENDLIAVKGKGSQNTVDGDNGPVTYNNVSAFGVKNLGPITLGEKPKVDNDQTVADDDIPF